MTEYMKKQQVVQSGVHFKHMNEYTFFASQHFTLTLPLAPPLP